MLTVVGTCLILVNLVFADISGNNPPCGKCLCADVSSTLNVRDAPYGRRVGSIRDGECYKFTGKKQPNRGFTWFSLDYKGNPNIWAAGEYLVYGSRCDASPVSACHTPDPPSTNPCGRITIVSRTGWGARAPRSTTGIRKPVPHVFIHHTTGSGCTTSSSCSRKVRGFQDYHMDNRRWSDIGYSFLIGGDNKVYEGRGWDRQGAHTSGYNSVGFGIAFIGTYSSVVPSSGMLNVAKSLIQCGVQQGHIATGYSLAAHRDTKCTECPGAALYDEIKTWVNWHKTPVTKRC